MFDSFKPTESLSGQSPGAQSDDGGIIIDFFPTETVRPMESLDDGGIIIIGGFPTEMIRPMESLRDGGLVIDWFPTETIRPMESLHSFELLI